ncbi:hypothetical protein [Actinomyces minihominis]|nr:hypothetical protein [Actinomyces minihominis]
MPVSPLFWFRDMNRRIGGYDQDQEDKEWFEPNNTYDLSVG